MSVTQVSTPRPSTRLIRLLHVAVMLLLVPGNAHGQRVLTINVSALAVEVARQVLHASGKDDIVTGLRTHTHMGEPDWERMLYLIREQHAPEAVDVYFCGPPGLGKKIRPICARLGMAYREEKF